MLKRITLLLMMCLLFVTPVFANNGSDKTTVQVTGSSQKEISPDIAILSFSVITTNANLEQAKNENAILSNQVLDELKAHDINNKENIKTNTYNIEPIYSYEKGRLPVLKGYRVNNRLEVVAPIEKVGILVNAITGAGVNEISSINFEVLNEKQAKQEALKEAVEDAVKKAEVIAATLNMKIARINMVNESGIYYRPLARGAVMKAAYNDAAVPNIESGKVSVGANVQVTVELE